MQVHPEVAEALKANKPVVALESTIISHGMPYPRNIEVAQKLEQIIRENGTQ
jgi:pseudouridine-5'-phosphate glycosidase